MSVGAFLASTPPEINIKIEAWNDARRRDAVRDYNFAVLLTNPQKFPSFERFYPEKDSSGKPKVDRHVAKAMQIAEQLGDI